MCALEFKGTNEGGFGGYELTDQLQYNLKWFLDWGLLNRGAYGIYEVDEGSYFDDDEARLRPVPDERYRQGQVWEGVGREWVWESGVSLGSGYFDPFRVSGVQIDGDFHPTSSVGINRHHVDYLHGRIIFDEPKSEDDDIRVSYTRRSVHVGFADDRDFRVMMLNAVEAFLEDDSPSDTTSREHQLWLPSIFVEVTDGKQRGQQLGGGQIKTRSVVFHVFADSPHDRNLLMDWVDYQSRTGFWMADLNNITQVFDQYGDINTGVTNWPNMVAEHPWKRLRVIDSKSMKINSLNENAYRARVTWEVEIDFGGI